MNHLTLKIESEGMEPFLAPPCTQELTLLPHGTFLRTLTGQMVFTGKKGGDKYRSLIKGQGREPPAFDGLWRGKKVTVNCIQYMAQTLPRGIKSLRLMRPCVPRSLMVFDTLRRPLRHELIEGTQVELLQGEGGVIQYQPRLEMLITDLHIEAKEKLGLINWKIILEEI